MLISKTFHHVKACDVKVYIAPTVIIFWVTRSVYWDYAMTIRLEEIVYLHCHQQGELRSRVTPLSLWEMI